MSEYKYFYIGGSQHEGGTLKEAKENVGGDDKISSYLSLKAILSYPVS